MDSNGQRVLLDGANFRGYHYLPEKEMSKTHTKKDYETMRDWGFNVVRLNLAWSKVEPVKGSYNDEYFSKYVDRDIKWASECGMYIILDMHTNRWSGKWNGNGAPGWAVAQYPATDEGFLSFAEGFWRNAELRASFVNMWKHVASRYAGVTTIAGYDLLNEPWQLFDKKKHTPAERWSIIESFYQEVIDGIRLVDNNHLIFVEPYISLVTPYLLDPFLSSIRPLNGSNLVWSPHFYYYVYEFYGQPYTHENATLLEDFMSGIHDIFVGRLGQPMWIGEFGIDLRVPGSDAWTQDTVQLFVKYKVGWAWWAYWRSGSDDSDMYLINKDGTPRTQFLQFLMNPQLTA